MHIKGNFSEQGFHTFHIRLLKSNNEGKSEQIKKYALSIGYDIAARGRVGMRKVGLVWVVLTKTHAAIIHGLTWVMQLDYDMAFHASLTSSSANLELIYYLDTVSVFLNEWQTPQQ